VGVGVAVAGGVVMVSEGTSLGAGAGWVGVGVAVPGAGVAVGGTAAAADGTQMGAASETCGEGTDDGETPAGASGTVAGWPAWEDVTPDGDESESDEPEDDGADAVV